MAKQGLDDLEAPITCQFCKAHWPNNDAFMADQAQVDVWDNECPRCRRAAFNYP
jgi:Zn finger protein HypA/HybF involved in hydrogenase expression